MYFDEYMIQVDGTKLSYGTHNLNKCLT